jgi:hypothetical protein
MRLLALHSFRTNSVIFKEQLQRSGLDKILFRDCSVELVFLDAAHPASGKLPKDVSKAFGSMGPHLEWFTVEHQGDKVVFDEEKLEASSAQVLKALREDGPFDGIIGFSQGAMLGAALVALLETRHPMTTGLVPLSLVILIAGFKSRHPLHQEAFKSRIKTPSIHIFGDADEMKEYNVQLTEACVNPMILTHPRGHIVPILEPYQQAAVIGFVRSIQESLATNNKVSSKL